jgi:hypothetical protein
MSQQGATIKKANVIIPVPIGPSKLAACGYHLMYWEHEWRVAVREVLRDVFPNHDSRKVMKLWHRIRDRCNNSPCPNWKAIRFPGTQAPNGLPTIVLSELQALLITIETDPESHKSAMFWTGKSKSVIAYRATSKYINLVAAMAADVPLEPPTNDSASNAQTVPPHCAPCERSKLLLGVANRLIQQLQARVVDLTHKLASFKLNHHNKASLSIPLEPVLLKRKIPDQEQVPSSAPTAKRHRTEPPIAEVERVESSPIQSQSIQDDPYDQIERDSVAEEAEKAEKETHFANQMVISTTSAPNEKNVFSLSNLSRVIPSDVCRPLYALVSMIVGIMYLLEMGCGINRGASLETLVVTENGGELPFEEHEEFSDYPNNQLYDRRQVIQWFLFNMKPLLKNHLDKAKPFKVMGWKLLMSLAASPAPYYSSSSASSGHPMQPIQLLNSQLVYPRANLEKRHPLCNFVVIDNADSIGKVVAPQIMVFVKDLEFSNGIVRPSDNTGARYLSMPRIQEAIKRLYGSGHAKRFDQECQLYFDLCK